MEQLHVDTHAGDLADERAHRRAELLHVGRGCEAVMQIHRAPEPGQEHGARNHEHLPCGLHPPEHLGFGLELDLEAAHGYLAGHRCPEENASTSYEGVVPPMAVQRAWRRL